MAVFRVERNKGYTVMSNHHLRNKELTLKAKSTIPQLPRGVPIITAEYGLTAYSTMARCITLHLDSHVDNKPLTELQKMPTALSTFWYHFLRWVCERYGSIVSFIRTAFAKHRESAQQALGMDRLADSYSVLDIGMDVLNTYMQEIDSAHYSAIKFVGYIFVQSLGSVHEKQVQQLKTLRQSIDQARFSKMLADLYYNERLDLKKKKHLGPGCDGAESKTFLYLTTDRIAAEARRYFPRAKSMIFLIAGIINPMCFSCTLFVNQRKGKGAIWNVMRDATHSSQTPGATTVSSGNSAVRGQRTRC